MCLLLHASEEIQLVTLYPCLLTTVNTNMYFSSELISVALVQKILDPPPTHTNSKSVSPVGLLVVCIYNIVIIYEDKKGRGQMFLEKQVS